MVTVSGGSGISRVATAPSVSVYTRMLAGNEPKTRVRSAPGSSSCEPYGNGWRLPSGRTTTECGAPSVASRVPVSGSIWWSRCGTGCGSAPGVQRMVPVSPPK
jgi:hypothetical protein